MLITRRGEQLPISLIPASAVTAAGFYAMASLGISTFLYANLAGDDGAGQEGQAAAALLAYGVVLALSVLALFYFLTLMLFERPLTKRAAKSAFWAGTIAGSVVVLRFLAGSAQDARMSRCVLRHACHVGLLYTPWGIVALLAVATLAFVVITLSRVLEWRRLRWLLTFLLRRPSLAPAGVFVIAVLVATLASLYINTRGHEYKPGGLIITSYVLGTMFIILFALASGSVIYPRVHSIRLTGLPALPQGQSPRRINWPGQFQARRAARGDAARVFYSAGTWPVQLGRGKLMWKVPGTAPSEAPAEIATEFHVWNDGCSWQVQGCMFLMTEAAGTSDRPSVQVTLTAGRAFDKKIAEKDIPANSPVLLGDSEQSDGAFVRVSARRTDRSTQDVLLCWSDAGGTIIRPKPTGRVTRLAAGNPDPPPALSRH